MQDLANNFMFVISVNDAGAWYQRAQGLLSSNTFCGMRIKPPELLEKWLVLHVTDPSGVLLVFVQALPVGNAENSISLLPDPPLGSA